MLRLDVRGKRVLLISDLHHPWAVDGWYEFLARLHRQRKYDIIISVGDEIDAAAMSFHEKEPGMPNATREMEMAQAEMQLMHTLFPKMYILDSNHGSLYYRRAKFAGIPNSVIKPMKELWGTPEYEWHEEILLITNSGPVYLCHGKTSAYGKMVKDLGCSAVQGHFHSKSEITYHATVRGVRFNMLVGCLADQKKLAFQYAKNHNAKFINSVGELDRNGVPNLIMYRP